MSQAEIDRIVADVATWPVPCGCRYVVGRCLKREVVAVALISHHGMAHVPIGAAWDRASVRAALTQAWEDLIASTPLFLD